MARRRWLLLVGAGVLGSSLVLPAGCPLLTGDSRFDAAADPLVDLTAPVVSAGTSSRFNLVLPENAAVGNISVVVGDEAVSVASVNPEAGWVEFDVPSGTDTGLADVQVIDTRDDSVVGTTTVVVVPAGSAPSDAAEPPSESDAAGDGGDDAGSDAPPPPSGAAANGSNHNGATKPLPPTLDELDPPIVKPKRRVRYTFPQIVLASGISVTVGGITAPIVLMTPEAVEFRVPADAPAGPATVEIRPLSPDAPVFRMQVIVEPEIAADGDATP